MITLVDAGLDGLATLDGALDRMGFQVVRATRPEAAADSGPILLRAGGPFDPACAALKRCGWWYGLPQLVAAGRPVLGIGLGLHLLAEGSEESPRGTGLGLIPGLVRSLGPGVKLPHAGWAQVRTVAAQPFLPQIGEAWLYFCHGHALEPTSLTLRTAVHGRPFSVLERRGQCLGLQALPEKSGLFGLVFLEKLLASLGEAPVRRADAGAN